MVERDRDGEPCEPGQQPTTATDMPAFLGYHPMKSTWIIWSVHFQRAAIDSGKCCVTFTKDLK